MTFAIDRSKLEGVLTKRGVNLSQFAKECGISRQSLYNMFKGDSVFAVPFEKLVDYLGIDPFELLRSESPVEKVLADAPRAIREAVDELVNYAVEERADLFLIGSRASGKAGERSDWDFGIYFHDGRWRDELASLKMRISDIAFPYSVDLVNLFAAPDWFKRSVGGDALRLAGSTGTDIIFGDGRKEVA